MTKTAIIETVRDIFKANGYSIDMHGENVVVTDEDKSSKASKTEVAHILARCGLQIDLFWYYDRVSIMCEYAS